MCINVTAGGQISGAGTHVSVLVHLMRGEYDSRLVWPFRGDITIQLVNHNNDQDHREYTIFFNDAAVAAGDVSDRVISSEKARYGWCKLQFISHTAVESSTKTSRYIINDCLTFQNNQNSSSLCLIVPLMNILLTLCMHWTVANFELRHSRNIKPALIVLPSFLTYSFTFIILWCRYELSLLSLQDIIMGRAWAAPL